MGSISSAEGITPGHREARLRRQRWSCRSTAPAPVGDQLPGRDGLPHTAAETPELLEVRARLRAAGTTCSKAPRAGAGASCPTLYKPSPAGRRCAATGRTRFTCTADNRFPGKLRRPEFLESSPGAGRRTSPLEGRGFGGGTGPREFPRPPRPPAALRVDRHHVTCLHPVTASAGRYYVPRQGTEPRLRERGSDGPATPVRAGRDRPAVRSGIRCPRSAMSRSGQPRRATSSARLSLFHRRPPRRDSAPPSRGSSRAADDLRATPPGKPRPRGSRTSRNVNRRDHAGARNWNSNRAIFLAVGLTGAATTTTWRRRRSTAQGLRATGAGPS